ncbi:unnamed protein product [Medioppia subpectinata]|uniref:Uncharacterized protein n=2 Tax=Medioppia subpectinata TaxID=1979941 RepID=A0A7R9PVY5_9ACAR|nr:unnamed protein product [Medioppia subpectinata]CAG2103349.1 unnamed protein product [Medioppia subpectinata]
MSQIGAHLQLSSLHTIGHNMGINSTPVAHNQSSSSAVSAPAVGVTPLPTSAPTSGPTSGVTNNNQSICCLIEDTQRCHRIAGNASYSKRIEKQVTQRKLRLTLDHRSHHSYICEHHKQMIQSIRTSNKRKRKDSDDDNELTIDTTADGHTVSGGAASATGSAHDVDLHALQVNTLRRYKKHYRIQTRPGINKSQLAETLQRHFKSMPIYEKEAITYFIYMVKCNKNKLDQNNTSGGGTGAGAAKQTALASD